MLFKVATDHMGLFGGDDGAASKVAGVCLCVSDCLCMCVCVFVCVVCVCCVCMCYSLRECE